MSDYTFQLAKPILSKKLRWLDKLNAEKWVNVRRYAERRFEKTFGHPMPEIKTNVGSKISETLAEHLLNSIYIPITPVKVEKPEKPENSASFMRVYSEAQMSAFMDFVTRIRNRYMGDERRRKNALQRKSIELTTEGAAVLKSLAKRLNASNSLVIETILLDADEEFKEKKEELQKSNQAKKDAKKKVAELTDKLAELEAELKLKQMKIASQAREINTLAHRLSLSSEERRDAIPEPEAVEAPDILVDASKVEGDLDQERDDSSQQQNEGASNAEPSLGRVISDEDDVEYYLDGRRGEILENSISDVKQTNRHVKGIGS